jgi:para-aminobenzoate synthetase component I
VLKTEIPQHPPPPTGLLANAEPLVRRLPPSWTPAYCFRRLSRLEGCVWLDSSLEIEGLTRYSYLSALPFATLRVDRPSANCFETVARSLRRFYQPCLPDLPPMQGGWMGWLGYELGSCFEKIPRAAFNDFTLPLAMLGLYDVVLSWDHSSGEGYLVSQGWPWRDPMERQVHAYRRMCQFLSILEVDDLSLPGATAAQRQRRSSLAPLHRLAPQFPTRWSTEWSSNFSPEQYRQSVARCVEYVHSGDIFQVNLSQRLLRRAVCDPEDLALHLRRVSPSPFGGYADFGRIQVISSSPERFVSLQQGKIEVRPIKGTRPRLSDPVADAGMAQLLQQSQKDLSENVMIVDLLRNDLSRVADPESVRVNSLAALERYPHVWHLVSVLQAQLASGLTFSELLAAIFPGGSITGAPKIRSMEIIAEMEPTVRGPYCGSLGYISYAGDMDLNILIRTVTACDGWWQVPVGGGIVAESDPALEEQETWHKARGILTAIDSLPFGRRVP